MHNSWENFYQQFKADLKLWCYFVILQQICRICYIYLLANYLATETKLSTILQALLHGLRFDSLWATVWIFIALFLFTLPNSFLPLDAKKNARLNRYRQYLAGIFTAVTTLIYSISFEYFREYKDIFNQFLFGIIYDDKIAIGKTILAEHNIAIHVAILTAVLAIYILYVRKLIAPTNYTTLQNANIRPTHRSKLQKVSISCCILLFYVISFRGSIGPRPIQLKDAGVTQDPFLNKAVVSPYSALKYAVKNHLAIKQQEDHYTAISSSDITAMAKSFFATPIQHTKLSAYMKKTAVGNKLTTAKHVFLIVGESLDSWPMQPEYSEFALTPNLTKLCKQGLHLKSFLPSAHGTMESLNTVITGLPDAELHINYQKNSITPYPTAIAPQFKKLGFKTNFFYGGYLSWQRLGDFASAQGFDAVYGASHISNWQHTNEWGVDDRTLYNFIATTIQTANVPTFNVIMTTSNHPPFSIDLAKEGFAQEKIAKLLQQYPNNVAKIKELGHIWYADKTIGEFVAKMTAYDNTALFAITGDHYGRKHILPNPNLFDSSAVPLILYGNNIKQHYRFPANTAGSHLNIAATLIELVAPAGFKYCTFGTNLLGQEVNSLGIGQHRIITADFIATTWQDLMYYNKSSNLEKPITLLHTLIEQHNQAMAISWWLVKKGDAVIQYKY